MGSDFKVKDEELIELYFPKATPLLERLFISGQFHKLRLAYNPIFNDLVWRIL